MAWLLTLTFVGLWLVAVAYLHLAVWYEAKQIGDLDPKEALVPQPLPNDSAAAADVAHTWIDAQVLVFYRPELLEG